MVRTAVTFVLALALCAFLNFVSVRSYLLLSQYSGFADHFNTVGVIFVLFWLLVFGLLLRLIHPILGLTPASFALVYAALMVATVIPTMGFGGTFIPLIAGVIYYASPENNWEAVLWPHIPDWIVPRDPELIRQLFEGLSTGESIPWEPWVVPCLLWALFFVAFSCVSLSFVSLVHHQWSREERLVYPLAVTPTLMVDSFREPSQSFLRSRLLWVSFLFAWSFPTVNLLDQIFDIAWIQSFGIPSSEIGFEQLGLRYQLNTDLLVVGLSFLISLQVLFSVWFCHILLAFESSLLSSLGIALALPAQPHSSGGVLMAHQQIGALIFIVVSSLWLSRGFLAKQWRIIIGREDESGDNIIHPRTAAIMGLAGFVFMAAFINATGLALVWSILLLMIALLVFFGTTRLLAQIGFSRLRAANSIPPLLTNVLGTAPFGGRGLTAMGLSFVWAADIQLFLMGTLAHALKVCEDARLRISGRQLVFFFAAALFVSLMTMIVVYLHMGYRNGLINGYGWYYVSSPQLHWGWVADSINTTYEGEPLAAAFFGIGAGLSWIFSIATHRLPRWPLHPAGLAIALTNTVSIDWFSVFLAWLIKAFVLRYGGIRLYTSIRPFFLGLILGKCVGVGGASLVHSFYFA